MIGTKTFKLEEKTWSWHPSSKFTASDCGFIFRGARGVANFKFVFLSHFSTNLESFGAYHAAFMQNFPKHHNFLNFWSIQRGHCNKDHTFLDTLQSLFSSTLTGYVWVAVDMGWSLAKLHWMGCWRWWSVEVKLNCCMLLHYILDRCINTFLSIRN